jgi:hypothetical protein
LVFQPHDICWGFTGINCSTGSGGGKPCEADIRQKVGFAAQSGCQCGMWCGMHSPVLHGNGFPIGGWPTSNADDKGRRNRCNKCPSCSSFILALPTPPLSSAGEAIRVTFDDNVTGRDFFTLCVSGWAVSPFACHAISWRTLWRHPSMPIHACHPDIPTAPVLSRTRNLSETNEQAKRNEATQSQHK